MTTRPYSIEGVSVELVPYRQRRQMIPMAMQLEDVLLAEAEAEENADTADGRGKERE